MQREQKAIPTGKPGSCVALAVPELLGHEDGLYLWKSKVTYMGYGHCFGVFFDIAIQEALETAKDGCAVRLLCIRP